MRGYALCSRFNKVLRVGRSIAPTCANTSGCHHSAENCRGVPCRQVAGPAHSSHRTPNPFRISAAARSLPVPTSYASSEPGRRGRGWRRWLLPRRWAKVHGHRTGRVRGHQLGILPQSSLQIALPHKASFPIDSFTYLSFRITPVARGQRPAFTRFTRSRHPNLTRCPVL